MERISNNMLNKCLAVYLDDIIIYSKEHEEHRRNVEKAIRILESNKFRVNKRKVQYCQNEVRILGMIINGKKKIALNEKKYAIQNIATPTPLKECRSFLGSIGWFRGFIQNFSEKTENLTNRRKNQKKILWNDRMETEFTKTKMEIKTMENLNLPDFENLFVLRTDASNTGLGAVLYQKDSFGISKPIEWASKKLTPTESKYGRTEKEMLAVYWAMRKFEYELRRRRFVLEPDHKALLEIRKKAEFNNRRVNK